MDKPAIFALQPWFGDVRVKVNDDGNCFASSWMLLSVCWAVQRPDRLSRLLQLLNAVFLEGAFRELGLQLQVRRNPCLWGTGSLR